MQINIAELLQTLSTLQNNATYGITMLMTNDGQRSGYEHTKSTPEQISSYGVSFGVFGLRNTMGL